MLSRRDTFSLWLQRYALHLFRPFVYVFVALWWRCVRRYRIEEHAALRRRYRALLREGSGPVIICANHLTLIDSMILVWALIPWWRWFLRPSLLPWHLPERRNFYNALLPRALWYMSKCMPVVRRGPPEETRHTLDKLGSLLACGETIEIFPEGTRSRIGRIDPENATYGVGRVIQETPDARVVCVYLRGEGQRTYSDLPRRGEVFSLDLALIQPHTRLAGLRGVRQIATQIIQKLIEMEHAYFESRPACRQ
jgi:1-acyl-sn-glycerol-3-phosphate acyltransferase